MQNVDNLSTHKRNTILWDELLQENNQDGNSNFTSHHTPNDF